MRQHLARSKLAHLLVEAGGFEPATPSQDWAERLSQWLGPMDAIRLQSTLQAMPAAATDRPTPPTRLPCERLEQALDHLRTALAQTIHALHPGGQEFTPYRQRHAELQRQMQTQIAPLRAQARQVLAKASLKLRQLATLDALYEQMLAEREQKWLINLTTALQPRFAELKAAHSPAPDTSATAEQAAAEPTAPTSPPWQADFTATWQQLLEHELDLRLQPVLGMLEALRADIN